MYIYKCIDIYIYIYMYTYIYTYSYPFYIHTRTPTPKYIYLRLSRFTRKRGGSPGKYKSYVTLPPIFPAGFNFAFIKAIHISNERHNPLTCVT